MPVTPKSGGNEIVLFQRGTNSHRRGLLPLTLVDGAWHDAFEKKGFDSVLKLPNQEHPLVETEQEVAIIFLRPLDLSDSPVLAVLRTGGPSMPIMGSNSPA